MKSPIFTIWLVLGLAIPMVTGAQDLPEEGRLSFDQAWELHRKTSPTLLRLDLDRQSLRWEMEAWYKSYLPSITAQGEVSRSASPLVSTQSEGDLWSFRGTLNMSLSLNSSLSFNARREALALELAELEYEAQVRSARLALKKAWIQYLSQGRNLEILRNSLRLAESRFLITQAQYEKGLRSDLEKLSAQIASLRDRPGVEKAQADQERRLISLKNLLGLAPEAVLDPLPLVLVPPGVPDGQNITPSLVDSQLEVRRAVLKLESAKLALESGTASSLGPIIGLSSSYNNSFSLDPLFKPEEWKGGKVKDSLGLGLTLRLPLDPHIPGSNGALGREKLALEVTKAQLGLEEARQKAGADIRSLVLDLKVSASSVEVQTITLALQDQNYRSILENYEKGRASLQELDTARQELQKSRQAVESEELNRLLLLLDLESRIQSSVK